MGYIDRSPLRWVKVIPNTLQMEVLAALIVPQGRWDSIMTDASVVKTNNNGRTDKLARKGRDMTELALKHGVNGFYDYIKVFIVDTP